ATSGHALRSCFVLTPPPQRSTLFPYTTLFRSPPDHPSVGPRARRGGPAARGCGRSPSRPGRPPAGATPRYPHPPLRTGHRPLLRSEQHTSELQSLTTLLHPLLLSKTNTRLHSP